MNSKITNEAEAREVIVAVSDYLLSRRNEEPSRPPFASVADENPTEKLTREFCHELLSSGIKYSSGCDLCGG